ncbi:SDR family NAD(P)-dependent oxidoreductase [Streptomyces diastatochromogenes]|uniref:Probable oxidoreductase n=1 Tax=Streptomyces diastatochromogenes TaxID=42236 RepID=A0A233S9K4_STRDA|nr:SDR family NAD(P)-dependent oxidoreductase [Streptomyces diastatochromogenes]MCZ0991063.1 SDR family NAD(P)-dependent oxidoreductase [Streptomyces diastatochromogenes]OXY92282.1 oxidoreductase [Streptomyces diastatochromogenes]
MTDQLNIPFTSESTTADVIAGVDLTGKRAIVTGASSGLGAETARALAAIGADVTLAVRNLEAGIKVAEDIAAQTGNPNVQAARLDLDDRDSIDAFTAAWNGPLHILVNNAGIMALPELKRTPEGFEQHFATNHLGHFALTTGLHNALAAAHGARVVVVSSGTHQVSGVVFDDIHYQGRPYDPWQAYGQSKTANILFAVEAAKRWAGDNITVNAIEPGAIYDTGLLRHVEITPEFQQIVDNTPWKTVEQGAATQTLLAASPLLEGVTGGYFADSNVIEKSVTNPGGLAPHAADPEAATRLWELSTELLNQK